MQGRLGKFSSTEWLLLLGLLSAAGTVAHDLMTHPLAWTARVEAYHDGGRARAARGDVAGLRTGGRADVPHQSNVSSLAGRPPARGSRRRPAARITDVPGHPTRVGGFPAVPDPPAMDGGRPPPPASMKHSAATW